MLALCVSWILWWIFCRLLGDFFLPIFKKTNTSASSIRRSWQAVWLGLVIGSQFLFLLSFFMPLANYWLTGALLAFFAIAGVKKGKYLWAEFCQHATAPKIIFALFSIFFWALLACQRISLGDVGLYHGGMVAWLAEHGTVAGLGLLHYRYAFVSPWFCWPALFQQGGLEWHFLSFAGGGIAWWLTLQAGFAFLNPKRSLADSFLVLAAPLALLLPLLTRLALTPSPDIPSVIFVVLMAWFLLCENETDDCPTLLPVLFGVLAASVKASVLPLALVGVLYAFKWRSAKDLALRAIILCAGPLLLAIGGIIVGGYFLFPLPFKLDLPWTLPAETATAIAATIRRFALWGNHPTPTDASFIDWFLHWTHIRHQVNLIACGYLALNLLSFFVWIKHRQKKSPQHSWIALLLFFGVLFFIQAPDPRFVWGYLSLGPAMAWMLWWNKAKSANALSFTKKSSLLSEQEKKSSTLFSKKHNLFSEKSSGSKLIWLKTLLLIMICMAPTLLSFKLKSQRDKRIAKGVVTGLLHLENENIFIWPAKLPALQDDIKKDACVDMKVLEKQAGELIYQIPTLDTRPWASSLLLLPYELDAPVYYRDPLHQLKYGFRKTPRP